MKTQEEQRFRFGQNWQRFLSVLNDRRISVAEESLKQMLQCETLAGKRFLDIGSGSGLFSLAARRLGAAVHSFDYDEQSVACTAELKARYCPDDREWTIERGSVLDLGFMKSLGAFDIVYAWGVLHHTGDMWKALEYSQMLVKNGGAYYIALYNDQGSWSEMWKRVKRVYCSGPMVRPIVTFVFCSYWIMSDFFKDVVRLRNPLKRYYEYKQKRGMSVRHDWTDWLGGYPFEVAKPEDVFEFCRQKGFELVKMTTTNSLGNNQFVFRKQMPTGL